MYLHVGVVASTKVDIGGGSVYETAILESLELLEGSDYRFTIITKQVKGFSAPGVVDKVMAPHLLASTLKLDLLYFLSPIFAQGNWNGVPYICTLWDLGVIELSHFPEFSGEYGNRIYSSLSFSLPRAFRVVTDSNATKRGAIQSFSLMPEKVVPLGLPLPRDTVASQSWHRKVPGTIIYPAKYWPHKNHEVLFRAVRLLRKSEEEISLILTGIDASDQEPLAERISDYGITDNVEIHGRLSRSDTLALISTSKTLAMPTVLGPTNYPPLEAMALGTNVVMSSVHEYDLVLPDSVRVVDPFDSEKWANELRHSLLSKNPPPIATQMDPIRTSTSIERMLLAFERDRSLWIKV